MIFPKKFEGNTDGDKIKYNPVPIPKKASEVLFVPTEWHGNIALRFELYGCSKGKYKTIRNLEIYYLNIHQHVWCVCTSYEGLEYESHAKATAHQYSNPYDYKSSLALRFSLEI